MPLIVCLLKGSLVTIPSPQGEWHFLDDPKSGRVFEGVGGPTYEKFKVFLVNEMKACPNGVANKWREDFRNELNNPQDPTNIAALLFARRIVEV